MKLILLLESIAREKQNSLVLRICVAMRIGTPGMRVYNSPVFSLVYVGEEVSRCKEERKQQQEEYAPIFYQSSQSAAKV